MGNKSILGGKIANAINIHQEASFDASASHDAYPISDEEPQEALGH